MAVSLQPVVPIGKKPSMASFGGPGTVPGRWWDQFKFCYPMWENGGATNIVEMVNSVPHSFENAMDWALTEFGWSPKSDAAGEQLSSDFQDNRYQFSGDQEMTIAISLTKTGEDGVSASLSYRSSFATGLWEIFETGANITFAWHDGGGIQAVNFGVAITTNIPQLMVITRQVGGVYNFYINGEFQATGTNVNNFATGLHHMVVGGLDQGIGGENVFAEIHCAYGWDRALTENEITRLFLDRYAPVRSVRYVGAPDAGVAPPVVARVRRDFMLTGVGR